MSGAVATEETFGQLGAAMRALPTDQMRRFVLAFVADGGRGSYARVYKAAGYVAKNPRVDGWKLAHDDRVQAAIAEESKKLLRGAHPLAVRALLNLVNDPSHRDHGRAISLLLGRVDPEIGRQDLSVTHRVELSADDEALEQYRVMVELGVSREKLRDLFGGNLLPRLQQRLEAQMKTIEAKVGESPSE
jgi:phage terminase small subunit